MVDFLTFVYLYLSFTAFLIFVLLFGDAPWAQGTPLSFCRWMISEAWVDALEWVVSKTLGLAGIRALDRLTECCCERSNPALQIGYLIIWSVGYGLYWQHVFKLLPNLYAAEYHVYTGTGLLCMTLSTFLLASGSSPGRVNKENAAKYLAAYPPDGLLFPPKVCMTCHLPRPGRSKHCGACGGCIPRFDHHCGWVNACVGLHNTRVFLLFLAANLVTCVYALWLMVMTMRGELHKRGMFDMYIYDPATRERAPLHMKPGRFLEFLVVRYPVQVALGLFITVGGLLLAFFLAYQAYLISVGCTTYEQFKRNAVHKDMRDLAAAQATVAAAYGNLQPQTNLQQQQVAQQYWQMQEEAFSISSWLPWRRHGGVAAAAAAAAVQKPAAPYNSGFRQNWFEVLRPELFLRQRQQQQQQGRAQQPVPRVARGRHQQQPQLQGGLQGSSTHGQGSEQQQQVQAGVDGMKRKRQ